MDLVVRLGTVHDQGRRLLGELRRVVGKEDECGGSGMRVLIPEAASSAAQSRTGDENPKRRGEALTWNLQLTPAPLLRPLLDRDIVMYVASPGSPCQSRRKDFGDDY